jgi:hypothetical protein
LRLQQYKDANNGSLVRVYGVEGNDKPLVPGDLITHWQDRKSQGFVISVIDAQNVLVLWSRPPFIQPTQNPCGEVPLSHFIDVGFVFNPYVPMQSSTIVRAD